MPIVLFERPVTLASRARFGKGVHSVSSEDANDWFFKSLVKSGSASIIRDDQSDPEKEDIEPKKKRKKK